MDANELLEAIQKHVEGKDTRSIVSLFTVDNALTLQRQLSQTSVEEQHKATLELLGSLGSFEVFEEYVKEKGLSSIVLDGIPGEAGSTITAKP